MDGLCSIIPDSNSNGFVRLNAGQLRHGSLDRRDGVRGVSRSEECHGNQELDLPLILELDHREFMRIAAYFLDPRILRVSVSKKA